MKFTRFSCKKIYNRLRFYWIRQFCDAKSLADYLYFKKFHRKINWEHPEDLNQWINWLAFNTDTTEWSRLADKYAVRAYIAEQGYEDILVPLLAVWDAPEKIDLSGLPMQFVLKMNNGCGDVIIVKDKSTASLTEIRKHFAKLFAHPFGRNSAEPHYMRIKPLIIAEALLDISKQAVKATSLVDYKLYIINGIPRYCYAAKNRYRLEHAEIDLYRLPNWEHCPHLLCYNNHYCKSDGVIMRPKTLDKMMEIASKLAGNHPIVRIDFYEVDDLVYFGELTFTSFAGRCSIFSDELQKELGGMVHIGINNRL